MWRPRSSLIKGPIQKLRGTPDQRGMGAQSDFISEVFVPSEQHKEQQKKMAQTLVELGVAPEKAAAMLSIPRSSISEDRNARMNDSETSSVRFSEGHGFSHTNNACK